MRHMFASIVASLGLLVSSAAMAQQAPPKLLEKQPYVVAQPQLQQYPEATYFHIATQATQKTMPEVIKSVVPKLYEAAKVASLPSNGPLVLVYHGISPNPEQVFDVEVGLLVDPATKAAGEAQVRKLEAFSCASVLFTGSMQYMAKPYEVLFPAVMASGKQPTMEIRQMMLYFEKEDSANNINLICLGIQ